MLGQRKPHDLPLTLANVMNDVVSGAIPSGHPEIIRHHEGCFDVILDNLSLEVELVKWSQLRIRESGGDIAQSFGKRFDVNTKKPLIKSMCADERAVFSFARRKIYHPAARFPNLRHRHRNVSTTTLFP